MSDEADKRDLADSPRYVEALAEEAAELRIADLYGHDLSDAERADAREAIALADHLEAEHGYSPDTLSETFPEDTGRPSADLAHLRMLDGWQAFSLVPDDGLDCSVCGERIEGDAWVMETHDIEGPDARHVEHGDPNEAEAEA